MTRQLRLVLCSAMALATFAACSRPTRSARQAESVDSAAVKSMVIADSADLETCKAEIQSQGAQILYEGPRGLLMMDVSPGELHLGKCNATALPNLAAAPVVPISRPTKPKSEADLPTLLRLIPTEEIGAQSFMRANPTFDGRDVTVAILDTGIELDHPMLSKTPTGEDKIVGFVDLSGQGRLTLAPAATDSAGNLMGSASGYSVKGIPGSEWHFGKFAGSSLGYSEEVSSIDDFLDVGVVTYKTKDGWRGRVDTNTNNSFADEIELYDFAQSRRFSKLGAKRTLTFSLTLSADGKQATLCFDDGSHGTHVAGITAAYDPNGLRGVAPGARILAIKIGDSRLSGGSTTTASMMLAIDYAVAQGAQIINLSYGIRSGSNVGKSTIDRYVDKIAKETGMLFSISAGNEGPGLLTIGTPAGSDLAITNAAFLSHRTAKDNYGYLGVESDNTWYFSSAGPRLDGGFKPTLLAPGSALSSVPLWDKALGNYRGTSMASPQVSGGLALLLSAAKQKGLPTERAAITRAVYDGAKLQKNLALVEQGHGLMDVPASLKALERRKSEIATEYILSVNSPTAPGGKGAGIYIRSGTMPSNLFTVGVTPLFPDTASAEKISKVRILRLEPSADWISAPADIWLQMQARTFQVRIDPKILTKPGLHSEKIRAIDEATGRVAFEVPVTVISPFHIEEDHSLKVETLLPVGKTERYFVNIPPGTTAVQLDLTTDGPVVWGQLLDPEGRLISDLMDRDSSVPQPPLFASSAILRPGVYEVDLTAPVFNAKPARVQFHLKAFSLQTSITPSASENSWEVSVLNGWEAVKIQSKAQIASVGRNTRVVVKAETSKTPVFIHDQDLEKFNSIEFRVRTAKSIYDQMTDYPFRVVDPKGALMGTGALELDTAFSIELDEAIEKGESQLEVTGAFASASPGNWAYELTESRILVNALDIASFGRRLLEPGQSTLFAIDLSKHQTPLVTAFENCPELQLQDAMGRLIQTVSYCD